MQVSAGQSTTDTAGGAAPEVPGLGDVAAVIGGERVRTTKTLTMLDPADRQPIATTPAGGAAEVGAAIEAAAEAQRSWGQLPTAARGAHLRAVAQILRDNADDLAVLESIDVGKPVAQALGEVALSARYFDFYADVATTMYGEAIPFSTEMFAYTLRQPYGVVGHIVPWNYPLALATRSIAPALAVGNCSVVKPAEEAGLSILRLAALALEAGLPAGVLNVVTGLGPDAGAALSSDERIGLINFTGSVQTGSRVAAAAAANATPVILELGGKSPNILFADADLERALPAVAHGILMNAGQTCSAGSRLLVERAIHDEVVDRLAQRFGSLSIGRGTSGADLGPLVSDRQLDRVRDLVETGKQEASVVVGGGTPAGYEHGCYFEPTIFDDVRIDSTIAQEEIFGPVLAVTTFDDEQEARALADGTKFGLVAGVWTKDLGRAHRLAHQLQSGQVFLNSFGGGGAEFPFGGFKHSGFGRSKGAEAAYGYTQTKTVGVAT